MFFLLKKKHSKIHYFLSRENNVLKNIDVCLFLASVSPLRGETNNIMFYVSNNIMSYYIYIIPYFSEFPPCFRRTVCFPRQTVCFNMNT